MLVAIARALQSESIPVGEKGERMSVAAKRKKAHHDEVEQRINALHAAAGIPREPSVEVKGKARRSAKSAARGRYRREEARRRSEAVDVNGGDMPKAKHRGCAGHGKSSGAIARRSFVRRMDSGEIQLCVSTAW